MGSEFSNFSTPFTANIELSFGGNDDVVTVREVRRNVHNGMANRPGQQGVQGTERQAGGGAQQRHTSQTVERVNGAGGSVATGRSQQRQGGQEDLGGATGSSLNDERLKARKQNVAFYKAGNCRHKQGIAGQKRRHTASLVSCRPAPARGGQAESGRVTEIIKVD